MKTSIKNIINQIADWDYLLLFKGFYKAFDTDNYWISEEGERILNNPEDRIKVEEAVWKLKENKMKKSEEVELSSGKKINIRID
jgi:hypothetical protein